MLALLRLISIRHMFGAPLRSGLTVLGVGVGVATMVSIAAINRAVMDSFRSTVDTISGKADLTVAGSQAGFDDSLVEKVKAVPGVAHVSGGLTVVAPVKGGKGESLYVMGLDLLDDGHFRTFEGADRDIGSLADDLEFLNSTDRMLVSERFAAAHALKAESTFTLLTSEGAKDFVVHGLIKESGPVKAFGGWVGVMYVGSAQEAFGRGRMIDRIDVAVDPAVGVDAARDALRRELGPAFEIDRPSRRGGSVESMVRSFQMGLNLGSGVALLVGVFLVYNTVAIGVVQRRREIGTLRALGASRLRIRSLFTLEAVVLGGLGTAIGIPLGGAIARSAIARVSDTISNLYVQVNAHQAEVGPQELFAGILLGLGGSVFAALRPAVVASSVQPVEALRRDIASGVDEVSLRSGTTVLGALMLLGVYPATLLPQPVENFALGGYVAIFLALMGASLLSPLLLRVLQPLYQRPAELALGISGRLAADNFSRTPARTAVPVSALAVGVGMTVCIAGFVGSFKSSAEEWIDKSVPADLFITSSAKLSGVRNTPMSPGLGEEIDRIPGIEALDRVRIFPHDLMGLRIFVVSLIPEVYHARGKPRILEGHWPTREERDRGVVTISENLMRRRELHAGAPFEMPTPTGVRKYTVGAVIVDYTSDQGAIFMDRRIFSEHFQDDRVDTYEAYLNDPSRLEEVRRTISERFGEKYDLYVLSNRELRDEAHVLVDGAFSVTYAMEVVAVLLALLGVINTLLAAVLDRTREIGLLRAVGAGRAHVVRLFAAEAALIGITGGALGVAIGVVTGLTVTKVVGMQATGWSFPYLFPWTIAVQMVVAATVCSVVAGLYPARRAASLDVVEALAYE
ncbi:MAG: FtsX-like permease family protein [Myxococcales bacterium]|nr:FtsX-like permease family protein [Myxococcales bacterium]